MSEIERLKASVLAQSHEKGKLRLEGEAAKLEADFKAQKEQLLFKKNSEREVQLKALTRQVQREEQQLKNQERQSTLATKQKVLKELFKAATDKMVGWDEARQVQFIQGVLSAYADQDVTVRWGALTAEKLSAGSLEQLKAAYPKAVFASDVLAEQAGLVVSDGHVEYDYLYSSLVNSVWDEESFRIASEIFKA